MVMFQYVISDSYDKVSYETVAQSMAKLLTVLQYICTTTI